MKLPISQRLLCCADLIPEDAKVVDLGTDHGYLPIYLAQHRPHAAIYAGDLRPMPLEKAKQNAAIFGVSDRIDFRLSDGLSAFRPEEADTVICAGMGGDLVIHILSEASWLCDGHHRLILQPQSSGQDVRRYLSEIGFSITREVLVQEGGFLYCVMLAEFGNAVPLTPGQQFISPALLASGDPLLPKQLKRLLRSLRATVQSMAQSRHGVEKLAYYQTALRELEEMEHDNGCRNS